MRPFSHPDGHDDPGLFDEAVPNVTAMVEDILIGREDPIREPVVRERRQRAVPLVTIPSETLS